MASSSFPLSFEILVALVASRPGLSGTWHNPDNLLPSLPPWGEAINELLEKSLESGVLHPVRPVTRKGEGVLVLAERGMGRSGPGLSERVLMGVSKMNEGLGPSVEGKPALFQVLPGFLVKGPTLDDGAARMVKWIRASSKEEITALDPPEGPEGVGLLQFLFQGHAKASALLSPKTWTSIIRALRESDVEWVHPGIAQYPKISTRMLEALCQEGLDLSSSWKGVSTWQGLLRLNRPAITRVVESHIGASGAQVEHAQEQVAIAVYLAKFSKLIDDEVAERRAGLADELREKVVSHLVSMPGWHEVSDESGRSAFFHAVLANPGVLRHALVKAMSAPAQEQEQWKKALTHRDNKGRNIWFYLYARVSAPTLTAALLSRLREIVPSSLDEQGNGLSVQLLMDPEESARALALQGKYSPDRWFSPLPIDEGWPDDILEWRGADADSRKKALASALSRPSLSFRLLRSVPVDEETAAYKALSWLLYSPELCRSGGAVHGQLQALMKKVQGSPSCPLHVPPDIMEEYSRKILRDTSGDRWIAGVLDDLTRRAIESHLDSSLPEPAPTPKARF